jgi:hypothetical protein
MSGGMAISPQAILLSTAALAMFVYFASGLAYLLRGSSWMPRPLRAIVGRPQIRSGSFRVVAFVWVWFWVVLTQLVIVSLVLGISTLPGSHDRLVYVLELISAVAYAFWLARASSNAGSPRSESD